METFTRWYVSPCSEDIVLMFETLGVIQKAPTNQIDQLYKVSSTSRSRQDNEDVFDIDD